MSGKVLDDYPEIPVVRVGPSVELSWNLERRDLRQSSNVTLAVFYVVWENALKNKVWD